jgi:hypothetical protein
MICVLPTQAFKIAAQCSTMDCLRSLSHDD